MPEPVISVPRVVWRGEAAQVGLRPVPLETPIAMTYNRTTHAVMLASPADLEDFAVGFSLSEGIVDSANEILMLDVVEVPDGIECRMDLADHRLRTLTKRQRRLAGPSGCGLCGLDSLAAAIRPAPTVPAGRVFTVEMIQDALRSMPAAQILNAATHAVHAAAFWEPGRGLIALREDVGRHNALDKLAGALARFAAPADDAPGQHSAAHDASARNASTHDAPARNAVARGGSENRSTVSDGLVLLSSRISVEMVQKAATMGAPVIVAISAPTSLAIEVANRVGITLIGIARADGFEVFTHLNRVTARIVGQVA